MSTALNILVVLIVLYLIIGCLFYIRDKRMLSEGTSLWTILNWAMRFL